MDETSAHRNREMKTKKESNKRREPTTVAERAAARVGVARRKANGGE